MDTDRCIAMNSRGSREPATAITAMRRCEIFIPTDAARKRLPHPPRISDRTSRPTLPASAGISLNRRSRGTSRTSSSSLSPTWPRSGAYFLSSARTSLDAFAPSTDYKMANAPGTASSIWPRHLQPADTLGGTSFSEDITGRSRNHAGPSILSAVTAWLRLTGSNLYARTGRAGASRVHGKSRGRRPSHRESQDRARSLATADSPRVRSLGAASSCENSARHVTLIFYQRERCEIDRELAIATAAACKNATACRSRARSVDGEQRREVPRRRDAHTGALNDRCTPRRRGELPRARNAVLASSCLRSSASTCHDSPRLGSPAKLGRITKT